MAANDTVYLLPGVRRRRRQGDRCLCGSSSVPLNLQLLSAVPPPLIQKVRLRIGAAIKGIVGM